MDVETAITASVGAVRWTVLSLGRPQGYGELTNELLAVLGVDKDSHALVDVIPLFIVAHLLRRRQDAGELAMCCAGLCVAHLVGCRAVI